MAEDDKGEAQTLGLLIELRDLCTRIADQHYDGANELHDLLQKIARPNLPDIPEELSFKVEQRHKTDRVVIRLMALTGNADVAVAAFDAAVKTAPGEAWTLSNGVFTMRDYRPKGFERP